MGDGTTTSTLLAHAIVSEGVRNIAASASAIDLKRGLDRAARVAIDGLRVQSGPVQSEREKQQVATIPAHNDPAIGELVARAIQTVGAEGAVTVEEAKGTETIMEVVEGLQFDRGYLSPCFVTDPEKMEAVLEGPFVLLSEGRITTVKDFLLLLEQIAKGAAPLLVIAEAVEGEALATLAVNRLPEPNGGTSREYVPRALRRCAKLIDCSRCMRCHACTAASMSENAVPLSVTPSWLALSSRALSAVASAAH